MGYSWGVRIYEYSYWGHIRYTIDGILLGGSYNSVRLWYGYCRRAGCTGDTGSSVSTYKLERLGHRNGVQHKILELWVAKSIPGALEEYSYNTLTRNTGKKMSCLNFVLLYSSGHHRYQGRGVSAITTREHLAKTRYSPRPQYVSLLEVTRHVYSAAVRVL